MFFKKKNNYTQEFKYLSLKVKKKILFLYQEMYLLQEIQNIFF